MSHKFPLTSSFHNLLKEIDYDLSEQERAKGCAHCGGSLHRSDYPRSPCGVPVQHRKYYEERYSHCCSQCRKRSTSQSLRYFGRRWFPAPLLTLISALMHSATDKFCTQLHRLFGVAVSKRTCERWKRWWSDSFTATNFWKGVAGIIPIDHLNGPFPRRLFSMYTQTSCSDVFLEGKAQTPDVEASFGGRLVLVLRFLAPLTAGVLRAV
jgi:hypothetical protein